MLFDGGCGFGLNLASRLNGLFRIESDIDSSDIDRSPALELDRDSEESAGNVGESSDKRCEPLCDALISGEFRPDIGRVETVESSIWRIFARSLPLGEPMPLTKRKRSESDVKSPSSPFSDESYEEKDVDISLTLTGKRAKITGPDDEDELAEFIRTSIAKRSIKEGTSFLKKSKGKGNFTKGEVGGGSFQSMG